MCPATRATRCTTSTETGPLGAMGLGGKEESNVTSMGTFMNAIDYKTGKIVWRHRYAGSGSWGGTYIGHAYLTTAGRLLFGGDPGGNIVAYDAGERPTAVARTSR